MRNLRTILIVFAALATVLLGLDKIGDTPIAKGHESGFEWRQEANGDLVFSADPGGNMNCWLRLKVATTNGAVTGETSTRGALRVSQQNAEPGFEWLSVTKSSNIPEDKFDWPSGATVTVHFPTKSGSHEIRDWYVYPSDKGFDSRARAQWRRFVFYFSLVLLALSLIGIVLETLDKVRHKREPFTAQGCLQLLTGGIEGDDDRETKRMRVVLAKVLLEGATVQEVIAPLKLTPTQQKIFWIKTATRFRNRLGTLVGELGRYLRRI